MYEGSMIGGHRVGELLGVGGAASVYRATPDSGSGPDEKAEAKKRGAMTRLGSLAVSARARLR